MTLIDVKQQNQNIICIRCPMGCELEVVQDSRGVVRIAGSTCKLGREYAAAELRDPRRIVTTTVRVKGGEHRLVPVWTGGPVPRDRVMEVVEILRELELQAPVKVHDIVVRNILGLGVDVESSGSVPLLNDSHGLSVEASSLDSKMNNYELEAKRRIDTALREAETTRKVIISSGALERVGSCFQECFGDKPLVIIADTNTCQAAGKALYERLQSQGQDRLLPPFVIDDEGLYAEDKYVRILQDFLASNQAIPVVVGSGTLNDLVKLAAFRCDRQYMVVVTAGSVDGYTAFGSSITVDDFKQTVFCPAPVAVVVDLDVIAHAPGKMNSSGYADLIAKIPAGADWILAEALGIEPIDPVAWKLIQSPLRELAADPSGIRSGNRKSLAALMEGLILAGLAMQKTRSSRPASGADHQFSHLWDDQHHKFAGLAPSHGSKVGIGAIASEAMYAELIALEKHDICVDRDKISRYWPRWDDVENTILRTFTEKELAEQVLIESREKYCTVEQLLERNIQAKEKWPDIKERLFAHLLGPHRMQLMIKEAGSEFMPEQIGIDRERLRLSYSQAQLIRRRYTAFDFILGAGLWERCVGALFVPGGFWQEQNSARYPDNRKVKPRELAGRESTLS